MTKIEKDWQMSKFVDNWVVFNKTTEEYFSVRGCSFAWVQKAVLPKSLMGHLFAARYHAYFLYKNSKDARKIALSQDFIDTNRPLFVKKASLEDLIVMARAFKFNKSWIISFFSTAENPQIITSDKSIELLENMRGIASLTPFFKFKQYYDFSFLYYQQSFKRKRD